MNNFEKIQTWFDEFGPVGELSRNSDGHWEFTAEGLIYVIALNEKSFVSYAEYENAFRECVCTFQDGACACN